MTPQQAAIAQYTRTIIELQERLAQAAGELCQAQAQLATLLAEKEKKSKKR